jgi:S-adenosylmethionine hydrolase
MDPADAVWLDNLQPQTLDSGEIVGRIVAADHFGNLISNIDVQMLTAARRIGQDNRIRIKIGSHVICGMTETYGSGRSNTPLAIIGSRGYLEIAIKNGNAAQVLDARKGDAVRVII